MFEYVLTFLVAANILGAFIGSWLFAHQKLKAGYWFYVINGILILMINSVLVYQHPEQWALLGYIVMAFWFFLQARTGLRRLKHYKIKKASD